MVNFLIGSIHTWTADQELVSSHTCRNQQEPHGRPGWFEWRKHAAFSSALVILVTWTDSSSSPEVWGTVSSDRTNSFPLKGIFPVSLNSLRKAEQEKNKSKNVDSCVKEALKRWFRRIASTSWFLKANPGFWSRTLKDQRSRLEWDFLSPQRCPNQYNINN